MSLADVGRAVLPQAPAPASAIERKVAELLEDASGVERVLLQGMLADYRSSTGEQKVQAEEALLDYFLEHDSSDGEDDEDLGDEE